MKSTIDGGNTKVFAKAVQSLSKFGGDLFIEADIGGMQLRTLNPTKSAVGTYRFSRSFFDFYEVDQNEESFCKLDMRACLTVFRNTKQVERCDMALLYDRTKFQIQLKCQHETLKNTFISVDDEENITTDMTPENSCNTICGSHKTFTEISNNFNPAEEEITLEAQEKKVNVMNYVEGSRVNEKFMRSQLQLNADEFETYKIEKETSITFCLKELRAFLMFAEALNESLCLHFDEAGSPVFVGISHRDEINCILIMSTLSPEEVPNQCKNIRRAMDQKFIAEDTTLSNSSSLFTFVNSSSKRNYTSLVAVPRNHNTSVSTSSLNEISHLLPTVSGETNRMQMLDKNGEPVVSKVIDNSDNDDFIPESPKRQGRTNLRSIFFRCFQSTYMLEETSSGQVFALDSDTE
ncbi:cell cycle checkpoint control protein RAD9A isoform X2 [Bactrocera oleae]|uniref:cell cycle checkpoint control protein RAD9A isoform X2 n=1 Tax=Bactrocera oleae TaxID=104688 RepID=UPI00387EDE07